MSAKLPILALTLLAGSMSLLAQHSEVTRLDGSTVAPAEIDETVIRPMKAAEVPGVGLAVLNDRKICYLKSYGFRDIEKNCPSRWTPRCPEPRSQKWPSPTSSCSWRTKEP
jgi:CubicO group peptidase (beta-lactamase class C family)